MLDTWVNLKCSSCGYTWNARAPKLDHLIMARKRGLLHCLKCGEIPEFSIPDYGDFQREGVVARMMGDVEPDKKE